MAMDVVLVQSKGSHMVVLLALVLEGVELSFGKVEQLLFDIQASLAGCLYTRFVPRLGIVLDR